MLLVHTSNMTYMLLFLMLFSDTDCFVAQWFLDWNQPRTFISLQRTSLSKSRKSLLYVTYLMHYLQMIWMYSLYNAFTCVVSICSICHQGSVSSFLALLMNSSTTCMMKLCQRGMGLDLPTWWREPHLEARTSQSMYECWLNIFQNNMITASCNSLFPVIHTVSVLFLILTRVSRYSKLFICVAIWCLPSKEIREGGRQLLEKLKKYRPSIAAFNGKGNSP